MRAVSTDVSRRRILGLAGSASVGLLSGCADFGSATNSLTLELLNFDSEPHTVVVELLQADADEYSEAAVLREQYDLETPPEDEDRIAYQHVEEDRIESDRYLVRVHLETAPATRETYQYYPDCESNEDLSDRLYIEVRTERESDDRYIEFKQNVCSGGSGWL